MTNKIDPNAPKPNMSAYLLYSEAMRETFKARNPELTLEQLAKYTSAMYSELSPSEKKAWSEREEADKARYLHELSSYTPGPGYDSKGGAITSSLAESTSERPNKLAKIEETSASPAEKEPSTYDGAFLKALLDRVDPAGSFATQGNFEPSVLSPKIVVEDLGTIGLPLHPLMAASLKEKATKAPFGRGPDTLLDESVRRAWQIEPNKVSVEGAGWRETMTELVKNVSYQMGISNENVEKLGIKANLYKVLLYEEGGHFKPHKDTEKEEGMFGTLVIQLPSVFSGGSSRVTHRGVQKTFDLATDCETTFKYMAFYADCEHEILPVTGGWRFCLVYNIVMTKPNNSGVVPNPDKMHATVRELQLELVKWITTNTGKIGYPLDHEYSLDNFGFGKLKGRDAVVLSALRNATDATSGARLFKLSLVIFYHKSYRAPDDCDSEFGVEEIILEDGTRYSSLGYKEKRAFNSDSPVWVKDVMYRGKEGLMWDFDDMPEEMQTQIERVHKDDIDIGNTFEAWEEHHDAGNEGGGSTTWYRSACIVLFPATGLAPAVVSLCAAKGEKSNV